VDYGGAFEGRACEGGYGKKAIDEVLRGYNGNQVTRFLRFAGFVCFRFGFFVGWFGLAGF
jgi:hypothetical protein